MHGRRQPPGDPRRARSSPSCNLESINNANRISPKQTHLSRQRTKERSCSAKGYVTTATTDSQQQSRLNSGCALQMSDRWIHDVSSSDDIDEHRCGFHGPIKKTIGKDEQILSSSHSRGKSSSQRRLLPPTPILLVVGSGESPRDMDSDEDDDDDSPPSRESHFVDSDFLDSSTPSSTTDVSLLQTNPSPCRRGRKLPSLPEPSPSCRKLSMQLQSNGKALAAPDEQSFGLSRNSTTRHMSMNNVLAAQTGKPVERQQNLEVPIGSLEAIFRRCSIFSKTSDNDVDDVNDEEDVDHKPISIITKGSRSVESICTARSEKEEPAGSPEPSLLTSSSATRLNAYSPGQTSTVGRPGKLTEGAKRSSWPNANNIVPPLERRPSACDLGLLHFSVQYFPVRKRLRVSIAKAEGLAANLRPDLELSTFLKVFLSPGKTQKQKSHRLVKRSNDTVYNEEFFFVNIDTDDIRTKSVEIRLCHRTNKQFHHDLVVGEVKLPLWTVNELTSKHEIHFVRSLIPRQLKKLGRIHLSACLETAARRLTVNIAKIDDLPRFEISGLPDPFVRITLDQNGVVQTKQTRIIRGTSNPVFKEAVMFLISSKAEDLQNMKLLVSVIDGAASRTSNEVIGEVLLSNMSDEKSCLEQWRNMLQNPGKEVKASHSLKAAAGHPL